VLKKGVASQHLTFDKKRAVFQNLLKARPYHGKTWIAEDNKISLLNGNG